MRVRGRAIAIPVLTAVGALAAAGPAFSADTIIARDNLFTGGAGGPNGRFAIDEGERPLFRNDGFNPHNVTARADGPDGRRLFRTRTFGNGGRMLVNGTQYLRQGAYEFICTIHPTQMEGTLVVSAGSPVARPRIKVAIPDQPLRRVRHRGRLRVRVRAVTRSPNASLIAKLGRRTLARKSNIDLAAGETRRPALRLGRRARRALRGRSRARVKLIGRVPFGAPHRTVRVLR